MQSIEIKICNKTIMDSTYPGIKFDCNGVSNFYYDYNNVLNSKWLKNQLNYKNLSYKISEIKSQGSKNEFDCILGLSGGLDSSFMLHVAVNEFKLRPLVFHVDGGWNTEIAVNNIKVMIDKLNLNLITKVIDWNEMNAFQNACFKAGIPHLDIPQDHAFISTLYNYAEKYNIKSILNGGNISTEFISMPYKYYYWGTDLYHIKDILNQFSDIKLKNYEFSSVYKHKLYLRYIKTIKVFKPLNFINFKKNDAEILLQKEYGWKPYAQKHFESRFTKFYEGYWLPTRFNFDVRKNQYSSLILSNQMSREEALEKIKLPIYNKLELNNELRFIANKLNITLDQLNDYYNLPKKYYFDYKNQSKFLLLLENISKYFGIGTRGGAF